MNIRQVQLGDFTVFRHTGGMGDDVIVKPAECRGADLIVLGSLFMDYGHAISVFYLREEEYQELMKITDAEDLERFIEVLYIERQADLIGKEG